MTAVDILLARRLLTCSRFRWTHGMVVCPQLAPGGVEAVRGVVVHDGATLPIVWWPDLAATRCHHPTEHLLPDLTAPATLGCLLALVREAWSAPVWVAPGRGGWYLCRWHQTNYDETMRWRASEGAWGTDGPEIVAETEAEALVIALEAAP